MMGFASISSGLGQMPGGPGLEQRGGAAGSHVQRVRALAVVCVEPDAIVANPDRDVVALVVDSEGHRLNLGGKAGGHREFAF